MRFKELEPKTIKRGLFSAGTALAIGLTGCVNVDNTHAVTGGAEKTYGNDQKYYDDYRITKPANGILKITGNVDEALHQIRDIRRCPILIRGYSSGHTGRIMYIEEEQETNCYPNLPVDPSA